MLPLGGCGLGAGGSDNGPSVNLDTPANVAYRLAQAYNTCFSSYSRGQYNNTVFDLHVNALYDFLYVNNLEADAIKDGMIVVPALRSGFDSNSPGAQAFTGP